MSSLFSWQGSFKSALLFRSVLFRNTIQSFTNFVCFCLTMIWMRQGPQFLLFDSCCPPPSLFVHFMNPLWTQAFFYENLMFKLTVIFKETLSTMIFLVPRTRRDCRLLFWVIDRRCCCSWNRNCPNICKHRTLQVSSKYWASAPLEHYISPYISL